MTNTPFGLVPSDSPEDGTFEAIFQALESSSVPKIGPVHRRLLVIPIRDDAGQVAGGLWATTLFQWLQIEMLFVPEPLRGLGVGTALIELAELDAQERGCLGAYVDTFSFQAAPFYRKLGYTPFGVLDDFPPGYSRLYFRKRFDKLPM